MRVAALALTATFALTACATYPDEPETASSCGYDSRNWQAWINAMPGANAQRTLHIQGEIDMPTPGWRVQLTESFADRAMPPGVHFRLEAERPSGMVTQVITPTQVNYAKPTSYPAIRQIVISCGGETVATIDDVPVAY